MGRVRIESESMKDNDVFEAHLELLKKKILQFFVET